MHSPTVHTHPVGRLHMHTHPVVRFQMHPSPVVRHQPDVWQETAPTSSWFQIRLLQKYTNCQDCYLVTPRGFFLPLTGASTRSIITMAMHAPIVLVLA